MKDEKYLVIKRSDLRKLESQAQIERLALSDATVIRGQDLFAAPALHSYANSIGVAVAVLRARNYSGSTAKLQEAADYFHERAVEAEEIGYKLPD